MSGSAPRSEGQKGRAGGALPVSHRPDRVVLLRGPGSGTFAAAEARRRSERPAAPDGPAVRARHLQLWLEVVAALEPSMRERFEACLDAEVRARVVDAPALAWLPLRDDIAFVEASYAAFGAARAYRFFEELLLASMAGPLLRPLVTTGVRLFGLEPAAFVKWWPKGWEALFRDVGRVSGVVDGPRTARIVHEAVPPECALHGQWVESLQGAQESIFTLTKRPGVVRCDAREVADARLVYTLEW